MDKATRNSIERVTQQARRLLEDEFREQLEGTFDILLDGSMADEAGSHLAGPQRTIRRKLVSALAHKRATGVKPRAAVEAHLREAAFTTLNRFVALKMLEARGLIQECVSQGAESVGFREFVALAPGIVALEDNGYSIYLQTIFDEISREVQVLFNRRNVSSLLWPRRHALTDLVNLLNQSELEGVWDEDETIGWVYQYFNSDDERREMRKESQAPRDSNELAVRNQFFTPRYVVEFLTDNTLGRIWYEMTSGETQFAALDYLIKPEDISTSASKAIAIDMPNLDQLSDGGGRSKKDPRDIKVLDPACGSGHFLLYAFDLFLTIYEEAWRDGEATIAESHGERLRDSYETLEELRIALPSLILKYNLHGIDIDPRASQIASLALWMRAQRAYNSFGISRALRPQIVQTNIVVAEPMPGENAIRSEFIGSLDSDLGRLTTLAFNALDLAGDAGSLLRVDHEIQKRIRDHLGKAGELFKEQDEAAWHSAEQELLKTLATYSDRFSDNLSYQRSLFAQDAARGFGFIDLCRKRYDVILMNPPFGEPGQRARAYQKTHYSRSADNLAVAFLLRGLELLDDNGRMGAITDCSWEVKYDYRLFREQIIKTLSLEMLIDLGWGVLDANVETSISVFARPMGTLIAQRVCDERDKSLALKALTVQNADSGYSLTDFARMPNKIFAYNLPRAEYSPYAAKQYLPTTCFSAVAGVKSCNAFADFRAWWEVPKGQLGPAAEWMLLHNGSPYCPFYYPPLFAVRADRSEFRLLLARGGALPGRDWYNVQGCAYGKRTDEMYAYLKNEGECFSQEGQALFPNSDASVWDILALANSRVYSRHSNYVAGQHKYHRYLNLIALDLQPSSAAAASAKNAYEELYDLDCSNELSPHFKGVIAAEFGLNCSATERKLRADQRLTRVRSAHNQINRDFALIDEDAKPAKDVDYYSHYFGLSYTEELVRSVWVSWGLGTLFGRWPESSIASRAVLVDDPGHPHDIAQGVMNALIALAGEPGLTELGLNDLASASSEFRGVFFPRHIRRFSRSRRKAPIYWQLSTASESYSIWVYYHSLERDTFFKLLSDYIEPKLQLEERNLTQAQSELAANSSRDLIREKDKQETFVEELRAFRTEVRRIAPLWNPNPNDGVIINFAPLWRLVPQIPAWQKKCKKCWDKLVAGEYDWASLAMHLWPERVLRKCSTDLSLAIAHDLDAIFWAEDSHGKWQPRQVETDRIDQLIKDRTSSAVKAALDDLLSAPTPSGSSGRKGKKSKKRSKR